MKVVLYNDTTHAFNRTHFGCQLVMRSFQGHFQMVGLELIGTIPLDDARAGEVNHSLMREADLIVVNGEGSLHHNRRNDLLQVAKQYPAVLVNTVFDSNDTDGLHDFKMIATRESRSCDAVASVTGLCRNVPDVICAGFSPMPMGKGTVKIMHNGAGGAIDTMQQPEAVCAAIRGAEAVETESFHAACIAARMGRMLKVLPANTHKNHGLCDDLGLTLGEWGEPELPNILPILRMFEDMRAIAEGKSVPFTAVKP